MCVCVCVCASRIECAEEGTFINFFCFFFLYIYCYVFIIRFNDKM